jgi:hypothetical protein
LAVVGVVLTTYFVYCFGVVIFDDVVVTLLIGFFSTFGVFITELFYCSTFVYATLVPAA